MKIISEISKTILLVALFAVAGLATAYLLGEPTERTSTLTFIIIKIIAASALFAIAKTGVYSYRHGLIPEWYAKQFERTWASTKED